MAKEKKSSLSYKKHPIFSTASIFFFTTSGDFDEKRFSKSEISQAFALSYSKICSCNAKNDACIIVLVRPCNPTSLAIFVASMTKSSARFFASVFLNACGRYALSSSKFVHGQFKSTRPPCFNSSKIGNRVRYDGVWQAMKSALLIR